MARDVTVRDAVRRLGDYWFASKWIRGHWINFQEARRVQRPDLVDAFIMRRKIK